MNDPKKAIQEFLDYAEILGGDEKGEAQVFCDRFFQAFGHKGYKEAGAELEGRVRKKDNGTGFIDLIWKPRLLLEMKKRGEKLQRHYDQAFEYWQQAVPNRPRYVVLCNFDEFWIYDFDVQLRDPVDRVPTKELLKRYNAFNFMFPDEIEPIFGDNRESVTRKAADKVAQVFNSLVRREEQREQAQRFVLQCVVAMFSEDVGLLPKGLFIQLLSECKGASTTYDLIGGLFRQMNAPSRAKGGRYKDVPYFNGGVFSIVDPIDLNSFEIELLKQAALEDWSKIQPAIFGTLFQSSMDEEERHALGAHYTSEADIQKVVTPTIVRPWRDRIQGASTLTEMKKLLIELRNFKVLDPACGSGNFLYVAYRDMVRLELELLARIHSEFDVKARQGIEAKPFVSPTQLYGIEKDAFGVELAKVTVMLAKELALEDSKHWITSAHEGLPFVFDAPLPLDNLDNNIIKADALFTDWPKVNAIIGNPPYQSKNKAQEELGVAYMKKVRARHPRVGGRADYCVYWFRKAHDELPENGRAGLVGTNTIRQNYSRIGGLDYIVNNGGTITEAVSTQVWPGDASVHVSIVNWKKGDQKGKKLLYIQDGDKVDSPFRKIELKHINSALSDGFDVTTAISLNANQKCGLCLQGQTHGHEGFLLSSLQTKIFIQKNKYAATVISPYLIGKDILKYPPRPSRYVIDFSPMDIIEASKFKDLIDHIKDAGVLNDRELAYQNEQNRNAEVLALDPKAKVNKHHENFLKYWWQLSWPRPELIGLIKKLPRYAACIRVTKRPIFVFIDSKIHPGDSLQVFAAADDYSFGVIQSDLHWQWFVARCSTMKRDFRYTSDTVFDTFPWPQNPTVHQVRKIADAAIALRKGRDRAMSSGMGLRDLYRLLDLPGTNPMKDLQQSLNDAVREAYGMDATDDPLEFLLDLNLKLASAEKRGEQINPPGLPQFVSDPTQFVSADCINA